MNKKWIYIAAPYTANTSAEVASNVKIAMHYGTLLREMGFVPLIPHLCDAWDKEIPQHYLYWIELTLDYMSKCDAVLRLPGDSPGADGEVHKALEWGIPVFRSIEDIAIYFS